MTLTTHSPILLTTYFLAITRPLISIHSFCIIYLRCVRGASSSIESLLAQTLLERNLYPWTLLAVTCGRVSPECVLFCLVSTASKGKQCNRLTWAVGLLVTGLFHHRPSRFTCAIFTTSTQGFTGDKGFEISTLHSMKRIQVNIQAWVKKYTVLTD